MLNVEDGYFQSEAVQAALWIDRVADRFEVAWQTGVVPAMDAFVDGQTGDKRVALLEELIRIDRSYRSQSGEHRSRDDYRVEFPELPLWSLSDAGTPPQSGRASSAADGLAKHPLSGVAESVAADATLVKVAGYEILDELGRGSMGIVYKARQCGLKRTVALKMILAGSFAGPEQSVRFRFEAEAVGRLQHPNIVQIYEVGEHNGLPYCSFEYVEGGSLAQRINGVPQPPRQAAELVRTLAQAMYAAHEHGVIHRDLKPSNILVTADGQPKIADFGLAKHLDADGGYTQTGVAIGTPSYMAVEQAEGRNGDVGATTDVYALGAILYEMLTGRPPFRGATLLDTLAQVRSFELIPPKRLQPTLSRDLETICLMAMAREPSRRYATAEALADDLGRWLDGMPILARPAGPLYKTLKWARRRPAIAALGALTLVAAIASAGGAWWHTVRLHHALTETVAAHRQADALRTSSDQQRERAESMVYATDMQLASAAYLQGDMFETSRRLERHLATPTGPDRREFTWKVLWALRQPNEVVFHGHVQDAYAVCVVDAGQRLVTAGRDGTLRVWNVADPTSCEILDRRAGELNFVAVAPDGITLAAGGNDGTVSLWNLATGTETGRFVAHANWVLCGAISPQSDRLATAGRDNTIRIWTLDGKQVGELKGHTSTIESLAFLPDGHSLASTGTDKTVRLWDVARGTGSVLGTLRTAAFSLACSHDGRLLAAGCEDHAIYLWDVASRGLRGRLSGHLDWVQCVAFSSDDARLASAGKDGSVRVWDVARQAQIESFAGNQSRVWSVAWLPDGAGLVSSAGDGAVRLWRREVNHLDTPLEETPDEVVRVVLATNNRRVWSVANGEPGKGMWTQTPPGRPTPLDGPVRSLRHPGAWCVARNADALAVVWTERPSSNEPEDPAVVYFYNTAGVRSPGSLKLTSNASFVALAPDAARMAVAYRSGQLEMYELPSLRLCWTRAARSPEIRSVQFILQGNEVIIQSGDFAYVDAYSAADGSHRTVLESDAPKRWVTALAVSPDGTHLATGSIDGAIRIWNYRSQNAQLARLECNDGQISALAFSPDGRTLVAGTGTGTTVFWHVPTWQQLARFKTRLGNVLNLCFSPEGDTLAAAGSTPTGNGQVLLWNAERPAQ